MFVDFKVNLKKFVIISDEEVKSDYYSNWLNTDQGYKPIGGGYGKHEYVLSYCTCNGNLISINIETGIGRAEGARHGIPWDKLGHDLILSIIEWSYPQGGTMTPHLTPWEHPSEKEQVKLTKEKKKEKIQSLPSEIQVALEQLGKLVGTRKLRKEQWIVAKVGKDIFEYVTN